MTGSARLDRWMTALRGGFRASTPMVLLIAAINTGVALLLSLDDPRPFWHPLVSSQCFGFAIAYCVRVASPWEKPWPVARLIGAVASGTLLGMAMIIVVKGYSPQFIAGDVRLFATTAATGFTGGLFVSLFFLFNFRNARTEAALLKAQAAQHLLSKQRAEAELKLMQAQIEPHFLFNTLASVQYLTETDPPGATRLLGHLLDYLRAALPQLRTASTALGKEVAMAQAYLEVLGMRMGPRLQYRIDVPDALREAPFPPGLLISIVENAIEHGLEAQAEGGSVVIEARRVDDKLQVSVTDTGGGIAPSSESQSPERGVGLANVRERLAALYGGQGRFALENAGTRGARAVIEIPV